MAGPLPVPGGDAMFADGIRQAQRIGIPEALEDRPVFHMPDPRETGDAYSGPKDEQGIPWNLHAPVDPGAEPQGPDVVAGAEDGQVLVSVVEKDGMGEARATAFGDFDPDRHALLFLLPEWEKVEGFKTVTISGNEYFRGKELPRRGLGLNTIVRVVVQAGDES